jgi:hypothetical protein
MITSFAKYSSVMEPSLTMAIEEQSKLMHAICDQLSAQDARWPSLESTTTECHDVVEAAATTCVGTLESCRLRVELRYEELVTTDS